MWFAVSVAPGQERRVASLLWKTANEDGVRGLFVPLSQVRTWTQGEAVESVEPLVPGLVVAVAPGMREVRRMLRHICGVEDACIEGVTQLGEQEATLLEDLTFSGARVVGLSEGCVSAGGRLKVTSGPLMGHEGQIRQVSHRNKRAYLRFEVAGREVGAVVGLRLMRAREAVS